MVLDQQQYLGLEQELDLVQDQELGIVLEVEMYMVLEFTSQRHVLSCLHQDFILTKSETSTVTLENGENGN